VRAIGRQLTRASTRELARAGIPSLIRMSEGERFPQSRDTIKRPRATSAATYDKNSTGRPGDFRYLVMARDSRRMDYRSL